MSAFFKSAAMSLLSRTLQALLHKYLSDVDVEGIALPSFSGNNDSGWGVRLCNVKLRTGATLMKLPGKLRKGTRTKSQNEPQNEKHDIDLPQNDDQKSYYDTRQCGLHGKRSNDKSRLDDPAISLYRQESQNHSQKQISDDIFMPSFYEEESIPQMNSSRNDTEPETVIDSDSVKSGDMEPTKAPNGWFSSWFYRTSATASLEENYSNLNSGTLHGSNDNDRYIPVVSSDTLLHENECTGTVNNEETVTDENNSEFSIDRSETEKRVDDITSSSQEPIDPRDRATDADDDKTEDQEVEEPTMMLQLGKGCFIGTLDVRLVGKTINIMIEDAYLTLEAIQVQSVTDRGSSSNVEKNDSNTKKEKSIPEPKTTGDRVLAENIIARFLSMIPNLFLRDINIRLVIRDDSVDDPTENFLNPQNNDEAPRNEADEPIREYGNNDSVIELVVELLSVTDGDDFLAKFRTDIDEQFDDREFENDGDSSLENDKSLHSTTSPIAEQYNDFITKRIRTGRGPEGGVTLKIFPAGINDIHFPRIPPSINSNMMWARQTWIAASQFIVLRCSGLDFQSRIFMGPKNEKTSWYSDFYYDYDETLIDTMLFGGVDYIAPGPRPPLPPMSNSSTSMSNSILQEYGDIEAFWGISNSAKAFVTDSNGIQSCGIKSWFHRVARRLVPISRNGSLLPCEYAAINWVKPGTADSGHLLDSSTPMPGLVCHLYVRDPIEINIDRQNLDTLGNVLGLFRKPSSASSESTHHKDAFEQSSHLQDSNFNDNLSDISVCSSKGNTLTQNCALADGYADNQSIRNRSQRGRSSTDSGFPAYMQPEKIQIIGIHLAELQLRIHWMKPNKELEDGVSFHYWSLSGNCITADYQQLLAAERPFQDARLELGYGTATEYKGIDKKAFLSVGVRQNIRDIDEVTVESFIPNDAHTRSAWPSTAAAMLDIAPPLESLIYEKRDRHALQIRYVSVIDTNDSSKSITKFLVANVGATAIEIPFSLKKDIPLLLNEIKQSIFGDPNNCSRVAEKMQIRSLLKYSVQLQGGRFCIYPLVDACVPLTVLEGALSSKSGFSLETFLEKIQLKFGVASPGHLHRTTLSMQQLAQLPESVRLRILLFLKDLSPLEATLGVKTEANSFLRYRSVNKAILKLSKQMAKKSLFDDAKKSSTVLNHTDQRQYLISELLKLDNKSLAALLETQKLKNGRRSNKCR